MLKTIGVLVAFGVAVAATTGCGDDCWDHPDDIGCSGSSTPLPDVTPVGTPAPDVVFLATLTGAGTDDGHAAAVAISGDDGLWWCAETSIVSGGFAVDSGSALLHESMTYTVYWEIDSGAGDASYDPSTGDAIYATYYTAQSGAPATFDLSTATPGQLRPGWPKGPFCP